MITSRVNFAYIRSYAYYSVTITLPDSLIFDADVYQISVTFYSEAISLVHIKVDNWVVWHTGKVLAYGAVGPRFKTQAGPGDFVGPIPFCIRMGTLLQWRGGLV